MIHRFGRTVSGGGQLDLRLGRGLYEFSVTAVINYHKSSGLKQHTFSSYSRVDYESHMGLTGQKSRRQQGCVPSVGFRGQSTFEFSCGLQFLPCGPFLRLQRQQ